MPNGWNTHQPKWNLHRAELPCVKSVCAKGSTGLKYGPTHATCILRLRRCRQPRNPQPTVSRQPPPPVNDLPTCHNQPWTDQTRQKAAISDTYQPEHTINPLSALIPTQTNLTHSETPAHPTPPHQRVPTTKPHELTQASPHAGARQQRTQLYKGDNLHKNMIWAQIKHRTAHVRPVDALLMCTCCWPACLHICCAPFAATACKAIAKQYRQPYGEV
jgi:hypothetical protein